MIEPKKWKRLSSKEKTTIIELHKNGNWKGVELAKMFNVTKGRISQILKSYYEGEEKYGEE
tara:strand:- start:136 stop:318 length:183 start_codon:yes stop_codon:yes gene_type:complete